MHCKVIGRLEAEPKLRSRIQRLGKKPCGSRRYATLAPDEFIDPLKGDAQMIGEGDLRLPKRNQEIFLKYLARMGRDSFVRLHD